ncbi:hypothetical protein NOV72_02602 [Caballeronia novacaledonica]|uniref:C2H2-type domain-containing protein n=1 Tax=Caballeronia novacaledonica TaxID=1544861 RepID=A0A2U3I5E2_9BURK|nr:hypothetical protein [Caballeronia novacaledonica]SPB15376.1 hypothetical protein NOV72_02602 [Caballeronia novacaledonica]
MDTVLSDQFECFHCRKTFGGGVYEIVHERCRLHFEERVPYVESLNLRGLECYCSRACLESRVDRVMAREKIPVTHPGPDRIANCSICRTPVDRTEVHHAYLATLSEPLDDVTWDTLQTEYLAVLCKTCGR